LAGHSTTDACLAFLNPSMVLGKTAKSHVCPAALAMHMAAQITPFGRFAGDQGSDRTNVQIGGTGAPALSDVA